MRTLAGGLPSVVEADTESDDQDDQPVASTSTSPPAAPVLMQTPTKRPRGRPRKHPLPIPSTPPPDLPSIAVIANTPAATPLTPADAPLPRSPSPSTNSTSADSTASSSLAPLTPSDTASNHADSKGKGRSPKRLLDLDADDDENHPSSSGPDIAGGVAETRSAKRRAGAKNQFDEHVYDAISSSGSTPAYTTSCRPPTSFSSTSLSSTDLSSGDLDLDEAEVGVALLVTPNQKRAGAAAVPSPTPRLTRRQRKQLGLPKPRAVTAKLLKAKPKRVILTVNGQRPGGGTATPKEEVLSDEQWVKNGSGRLDVRGFRELRI